MDARVKKIRANPRDSIKEAMELWDEMWRSDDFEWMSLVRNREVPEFYLYWANKCDIVSLRAIKGTVLRHYGEEDGEEKVSSSFGSPAEAICEAYEEWLERIQAREEES